MTTIIDVYPFLTVVPPLLAIFLVIRTRKVIISLVAGIISAAFFVADASPLGTLRVLWEAFRGIFFDAQAHTLNYYYLLIIAFLILLGIMTSLVLMSGGTYAFSRWMGAKIHSRRGAETLAAGLGTAIFVDDYFNALAVGQVARPVTDQHRVSRAKLSYLIDSSSAPVAVLVPFSSWGASIIGLMAPIVAAAGLTVSDAGAFIYAAGMNYYALAALALLWLTVIFDVNFGSMRGEERRARTTGHVYAAEEQIPGQLSDELPKHEPGARRALIVPFVALVAGVLAGIWLTGYQAAGSADVLAVLANTDVALSLNIGGLLGVFSAGYYYWRYTHSDENFTKKTFANGVYTGAKSMFGAIEILLCAWVLGALIAQLGTGKYLSSWATQWNVGALWLVPILFVLAGLMAFATGTSWGSFGILLPIAGDVMMSLPGGEAALLAAFGAVLAGAVWGDHCSPISDTTILSSTGAGCFHITHVRTQLPYAFVGAIAAGAGYVVLALSASAIAGFITCLAVLGIIVVVTHLRFSIKIQG